ncbi:MAG: SDR family NAD(P)-dependent oxidoreductase [Bacillales bacterium]
MNKNINVLISGTSNGIGKETALLFLEKGYKVYGMDKLDSSINNKNYIHIKHDIKDKNYKIIEDISILVLNAGVQDEKDAIEVNLLATINMCEFYIKNNKTLKSILFVTSASARNGAEFPLYSTSKGGLVTYMKNLALRLSKKNIIVNSIAPGGVITPLNNHIINNKDLYEQVKNETLLNKWCEAKEIAEWIYFLTVINKSMIGEDLLIDNGEMLKSNFIW